MTNCKLCGAEPKVLFRCAIGKGVVDVFLCESCYNSQYNTTQPLAMIGDEIITKKGELSLKDKEALNEAMQMSCPKCGVSLVDIGKTGRFGCDECYVVYSDMIAIANAQISNKDKNNTSGPNEDSNQSEHAASVKEGRLSILESRMKKAIKAENYEEAAEIRDEINELRKGEQL